MTQRREECVVEIGQLAVGRRGAGRICILEAGERIADALALTRGCPDVDKRLRERVQQSNPTCGDPLDGDVLAGRRREYLRSPTVERGAPPGGLAGGGWRARVAGSALKYWEV